MHFITFTLIGKLLSKILHITRDSLKANQNYLTTRVWITLLQKLTQIGGAINWILVLIAIYSTDPHIRIPIAPKRHVLSVDPTFCFCFLPCNCSDRFERIRWYRQCASDNTLGSLNYKAARCVYDLQWSGSQARGSGDWKIGRCAWVFSR